MTPDSTFLFADIAGFTALTEAHGDERAADLVAAFTAQVSARLSPGTGELVKSIGDALMLRLESSDEAVEIACELPGTMAQRHGYPDVRVGMNRGPAVRRGDDWFGATVNVAARVTALAGAGDVLLTGTVYDALSEARRVGLIDRGLARLRNVTDPVRIYACPPSNLGAPLVTDPVCRMQLDPHSCAGSLDYAGQTFRFCSLACAELFAAHPERYVEDRLESRQPGA